MAIECYADSSFLVSLYREDAQNDAAKAFMARRRLVISFSPLNRIELRNALRNAQAFGQMTDKERRAAFRQIDQDLETGLLIHLAVEWTNVFRRADQLSEKHAGGEDLDLLHLAIALEAGARTFLSFDHRQRRLARAAGLNVRP